MFCRRSSFKSILIIFEFRYLRFSELGCVETLFDDETSAADAAKQIVFCLVRGVTSSTAHTLLSDDKGVYGYYECPITA